MPSAVIYLSDEAYGSEVAHCLGTHGWEWQWFRSIAAGRNSEPQDHDCLLLEWSLRGAAGRLKFRQATRIPAVVVVDDHGDAGEMLAAVNAGADDVVPKSRAVAELEARLRNVAKKHASPAQPLGASKSDPPSNPNALSWGPIQLNLLNHRVSVGARSIECSPSEARALALMIFHGADGRTSLLRGLEFAAAIFSPLPSDPSASLRVLISRLRTRLRDFGVTIVHTQEGYQLSDLKTENERSRTA